MSVIYLYMYVKYICICMYIYIYKRILSYHGLNRFLVSLLRRPFCVAPTKLSSAVRLLHVRPLRIWCGFIWQEQLIMRIFLTPILVALRHHHRACLLRVHHKRSNKPKHPWGIPEMSQLFQKARIFWRTESGPWTVFQNLPLQKGSGSNLKRKRALKTPVVERSVGIMLGSLGVTLDSILQCAKFKKECPAAVSFLTLAVWPL